MTMPATVKIGTYTYRVITDAAEIRKASDAADIPDSAEWTAFSDHEQLIIGINSTCADDANRTSLLHEILHCSLRQSGTWVNSYAHVVEDARRDYGVTVEEFAVAGMTGPLLGVLQQNPGLVAWLTHATRKRRPT